MPDVTQSRFLPPPVRNCTVWENGVKVATQIQAPDPSMYFQQTSSYRGSKDDAYEDVLPGTDFKANFAQFRSEYVRRYDNGHEFKTNKRGYSWDLPNLDVSWLQSTSPRRVIRYVGDFYPQPITPAIVNPTTNEPTANQITVDGTKLVNMTIPTKAEAGLSQFLAELHEELPSLVGASTMREVKYLKRHKKANFGSALADENLNYQFAVKPTISDIQKFARSAARFSEFVRQMERDSGKIVRRRAQLRDTQTVTGSGTGSLNWNLDRAVIAGSMQNVYPLWQSLTGRSMSWIDIVSRSTSFSGAYSYHLAEAHSFLGKLDRYEQLANHLLGTRIDASTVWELTPWSWLIDWFADVGTFVSNLSMLSADSTVMRYGYVMHTTSVRREWTSSFKGTGSVLSLNSNSATGVGYNITKSRTAASPYGFGLNSSSFTNRQWSILGALGMTKSTNKLKGAH